MQGISDQNRISISSGSSAAGTRTASSEPVASCFVNSFSSACNAVIDRSTVRGAPSSPWHNERRGGHEPSKYSSPASSQSAANIKKELLKTEYKKNVSEFYNNLSSDPVVSCFAHSFSSACNTVVNRSSAHGTFSSLRHNERRGADSPSKYSSPASFKAGANITKELSIAEYKKNASESRDNSFLHRGVLNNASEKYRR